MTVPRVTVVIPVFNREHYVAGAIDSILAQTLRDFELVVIDDGSTDRSREIIGSYTDKRIRIIANDRNLGIPRTRNLGIATAQGEYLAFLDSDDYAYPQRLQRQADFLDRNPECAMVGCWERAMDEHGAASNVKMRPVDAAEVRAQSLFKCGVSGRAIMARTAALRECGFREHYEVSEDFDLCVRLSARHRVCNLPEVLIHHRKHSGNIGRERSELMSERVKEIIAYQLRDLGIAFSGDDLQRHFLLRRMAKKSFTPGHEYLEWAEQWLLKLRQANLGAGLYPEPQFSRVMGTFWIWACWRAFKRHPWLASGHVLRSPLRPAAWHGLRDAMSLHLKRFRLHKATP